MPFLPKPARKKFLQMQRAMGMSGLRRRAKSTSFVRAAAEWNTLRHFAARAEGSPQGSHTGAQPTRSRSSTRRIASSASHAASANCTLSWRASQVDTVLWAVITVE